jgi:hypothetical protein
VNSFDGNLADENIVNEPFMNRVHSKFTNLLFSHGTIKNVFETKMLQLFERHSVTLDFFAEPGLDRTKNFTIVSKRVA